MHCECRAQLRAQGWHEEEEEDGDMIVRERFYAVLFLDKQKGSPRREDPPFFWEEGKWLGPRLPTVGDGVQTFPCPWKAC